VRKLLVVLMLVTIATVVLPVGAQGNRLVVEVRVAPFGVVDACLLTIRGLASGVWDVEATFDVVRDEDETFAELVETGETIEGLVLNRIANHSGEMLIALYGDFHLEIAAADLDLFVYCSDRYGVFLNQGWTIEMGGWFGYRESDAGPAVDIINDPRLLVLPTEEVSHSEYVVLADRFEWEMSEEYYQGVVVFLSPE